MSLTLSPQISAALAQKIYTVQSGQNILIKAFLNQSIFSKKQGDSSHLKADVGSRLVNTKDGFGMCVRGGTGHEKDIF